jgi:endonuclease III
MYTGRKLALIIRTLEKHFGVPVQKRDECAVDPLDMLIATLLSQNTNDINSYRAWKNLKKKFPDYKTLYNARITSIESAIRTGGMAKQKAARIKELLRIVKERYGKLTLEDIRQKSDDEIMQELTSLNGIGVKTASCVILFALGRNSFPVDTHVHRVLNRLGIVTTRNPEKTFYAMQERVPPEKMYSLHTNLIRFGRSICKSQRPDCYRCPLVKTCAFENKMVHIGPRKEVKRGDSEKQNFMLLDNVSV